jgi:hypothetical protein
MATTASSAPITTRTLTNRANSKASARQEKRAGSEVQGQSANRADSEERRKEFLFQPINTVELEKWASSTQPRHYQSRVRALVEIYDAGDALDVVRLRRLSRRHSRILKRVAINALKGAETGSRHSSTTDAWHAIRAFFACSRPYHHAIGQFMNDHRQPVRISEGGEESARQRVSDERVDNAMRLGEQLIAILENPETPAAMRRELLDSATELMSDSSRGTIADLKNAWPHIAEVLLTQKPKK